MSNHAPSLLTDLTEDELRRRLAEHEHMIARTLASYEPVTATLAWFDTRRAIKEFINFIHVSWINSNEGQLFGLPVLKVMSHQDRLTTVRNILSARFSENFAIRFVQLVVMGASIAIAFAGHGATDVPSGFASVGSMIGYLMSRRRHFVALPLLCLACCRFGGHRPKLIWIGSRTRRG